MKNYIILLLLMLVASQAFSQKKKKKDAEVDSVTQVIETPSMQVDSNAQVIDTPAVKADSLTKVANTPAPKVAAAPTTTAIAAAPTLVPVISTSSPEVDSLTQVTRVLTAKLNTLSKEHEIYYGLYTTIKEKVLKRDFDPARLSEIIDSLAARRDSTFSSQYNISASLMDTLSGLKKEHSQMKAKLDGIQAEEDARNRLVSELKQLKELLDSKILTQSEFDTRKSIVLQRWK